MKKEYEDLAGCRGGKGGCAPVPVTPIKPKLKA